MLTVGSRVKAEVEYNLRGLNHDAEKSKARVWSKTVKCMSTEYKAGFGKKEHLSVLERDFWENFLRVSLLLQA